jgi:hypothetical protein
MYTHLRCSKDNRSAAIFFECPAIGCNIIFWENITLHTVFTREKPIFSSEKMLHKDYDRKGLVEKKNSSRSLKGLGAKTKWLTVSR